MKRWIALLLCACMLFGLMPTVSFAKEAEEKSARVLTEEDYATADLMWQSVNEKEAQLQAMRIPVADPTEALIQTVTSSPYYEADSLIRNGEFFSWKTVDGIACGYSPRLREIAESAETLKDYDPNTAPTVLTTSYTNRSGHPKTNNVYVIQPYYGIDADFTTQYVDEANMVASALGGSSTVYRTTSATIDAVANAIESGAVVFLDSHGDTDYASGQDYTSEANTSYLCLQTGTGLTNKDYEMASGPYNDYYHAFYYGYNGSMRFYCVDGTAVANHIDQPAQCSLLWMAICLSMATDGLQAPLRAMGVEVAYGYSQSVTFQYDYRWEECFWDNMLLGRTVATAVADMKATVGLWDWCHAANYDTIDEARAQYCAFPIVVSSEDSYPGHGNVDDLQTVQSTWVLLTACSHSQVNYHCALAPTCSEAGRQSYYTCVACGGLFSDVACTIRTSLDALLVAALGHSYDEGVETLPPTCTTDGITVYTCIRCTDSYTETILSMGHEYANDICLNCGQTMPKYTEFRSGVSGDFVIGAKVGSEYYAMSNTFPSSGNKLSATVIPFKDGFVSDVVGADYIVHLNYNSEKGTYTIESNGQYLKYPSSSNLSSSTTLYDWTISTGVNGSWRILSQTSTRALAFRGRGYNNFGAYYTPNISSGGTEYYDVEILPVGKETEQPSCTHSNTCTTSVTADCYTEGRNTVQCVDCGEILSVEILPPLGHAWDQGQEQSPSSCLDSGILLYTCIRCNLTETEPIAPLGHRWGDGEISSEAGCTNAGTNTFICHACGATKTEEIPELGHAWSEGLLTDVPTCTSEGSITYSCGRCPEMYTEILPVVFHLFTDGACTMCGLKNDGASSAFQVGHNGYYVIAAHIGESYYGMKNSFPYSATITGEKLTVSENTYVKDTNAEEFKVILIYDQKTGRYTISNEEFYLAHKWNTSISLADLPYYWTISEGSNGTWRITAEDTTRALSFCADTNEQFGVYSTNEIIEAGDKYWDVEILPVYTVQEGNDAPGEPPTVIDESIVIQHSLNLASDISINYAVHSSLLSKYDSFYLECILPVYEGNEETGSTPLYLSPEQRGNYYFFTLNGLTAVQMGNRIQARLIMEAEEMQYVSPMDYYAIADYAYSQLSKDYTALKLKKLCAELLRYGAQAQIYKNYRTDALVDAQLSEEQKTYLADLSSVSFGQNNRILEDLESPVVLWVGKTLSLESRVVVKFVMDASKYTGDVNSLTLRVNYKDYAGVGTETVLYAPEIYNEAKGYYSFNLDTLPAADLRSILSVAVYDGDIQVSPTIEYSPDSYGNGKSGTLLSLCKALFAYSDCAKAYFLN